MNENGLNYIDLFAGAGGLSEGFIQSGYRPVAHVEMNGYAAKTLETRIAYYYLKDNGELNSYYDYEKGKITRTQLLEKIPEEELKTVINKEMSESTIKGIFNTIDEIKKEKGIEKIDVIIGGPPCQAYSLVGRAQSSHMVVPMEDDPRNELYKMYVQFLNKYKPRMFVFENVAGIKSARGGQAFKNLQMYMKRVGYEICYDELNAHDFGVLQSRKRVIIVGWLKGTGYDYPSFEVIHSNAEVWDLLKDLPALNPGDEAREHAIKLLTDWNTIEAKEYAKIAIGRVKTIEQFEKFIQTNASERDVIQKFLEEFPWLLDAKMSKFEREITYTKLLKQKFNDESILPESNRRLDFLCTNSAGVIHVIELKRPRIKLTMKEIQQICEYVEFIETQFPQTQGNVKGFLISDNMTYEPGANKYRKGLEKEGIFIKSYSDLLAEARRYNDDLYKMYEDISMKKNNKSDK